MSFGIESVEVNVLGIVLQPFIIRIRKVMRLLRHFAPRNDILEAYTTILQLIQLKHFFCDFVK